MIQKLKAQSSKRKTAVQSLKLFTFTLLLYALTFTLYASPALADASSDFIPPPCTIGFSPSSPQVGTSTTITVSSTKTLIPSSTTLTSPTASFTPLSSTSTYATYSWTPSSSGTYTFTASVTDLVSGNKGSCDTSSTGGVTVVNPSPSPRPAPPIPTISVSLLSCIDSGYDGSGMSTISWGSSAPAGSWADISTDINFAAYYHKDISGTTSTTAPAGFNESSGLGPLTLSPSTTYYVRLYWNGQHSSLPNPSFTTPGFCTSISVTLAPASSCAPTDEGLDGSGITFSWIQPGSDSYAQIQVSPDQAFAGYYYGEASVAPGRSGSITAKDALANHVGSYGVSPPPYRPLPAVYYVRFYGGGSYPYYSDKTAFSLPSCMAPWIQVTGDVHSNTNIKAPGGP